MPHERQTTTPRPGDLLSLLKPRIVALLCLTGTSAVLAAGGTTVPTLAAFVLAGACIAGGSATLNCYYDRELDREMERTADRPLPDGRVHPAVALVLAATLLVAGTAVGLHALPTVSVGYMWLGVASYVGLYSVGLKRRHPLGVVLGGSAGSFPVLAGWSVVEPVGTAALAMATLVFAWTPAHAWALAYVYRDDFAAAGVATLPAVASPRTVQRAVGCSAITTVGVALVVVPLSGPVYAAITLVGSVPFLLAYHAYVREGTEPAAVRAFFTSNLYLAVLFLGWAADGLGTPRWVAPLVAGGTVYAFLALWDARPSLRGVSAATGGDWRNALRRVAVAVKDGGS